jgi:hypothetical protein
VRLLSEQEKKKKEAIESKRPSKRGKKKGISKLVLATNFNSNEKIWKQQICSYFLASSLQITRCS